MALLVLATAAGLEVEAVHVDHGLRPGSAGEAEVVQAAAAQFGARFRSERVSVAAGGDLEARARVARRAAVGPEALTGHTADDQAETLLINLLRGAGLAGLAAMRPGGVHPILELRRSETHQLCDDLGLEVVTDPSNQDPRFVRNRVRNELLPLMTEISDRDVAVLLNRTSDQARVVDDWIQESSSAAVEPTLASSLAAAPPVLAAAAIRRWLRDDEGHPPTAAEVERVMAVARLEAVACEISGGRRILRTAGRLRISR